MDNFKQAYTPIATINQSSNKPDGSILKIAGIIALLMASPFIAVMSLFVFAFATAIVSIVFGTIHELTSWILLALAVFSFAPAVKNRITGEHKNREMQGHIEILQAELIEARKQILELEEGAEFHRKLAETNSKVARSDYPINVNLCVTKSENYTRR